MGFVSPTKNILSDFEVEKDSRGNVFAELTGSKPYKTSREKFLPLAMFVEDSLSLFGQYMKEGRPPKQFTNT
jgi:hypothetical protein